MKNFLHVLTLICLFTFTRAYSQCTQAPDLVDFEYIDINQCGNFYSGHIYAYFGQMEQGDSIVATLNMYAPDDSLKTEVLHTQTEQVVQMMAIFSFENFVFPVAYDSFLVEVIASNPCGVDAIEEVHSLESYNFYDPFPDSLTCENYSPHLIEGPLVLSKCSEYAKYTFHSLFFEMGYGFGSIGWEIDGAFYAYGQQSIELDEIPDSSFTLEVIKYDTCVCTSGFQYDKRILASLDVRVIEDDNCGSITGTIFGDAVGNCFNEASTLPRQGVKINNSLVYSNRNGDYHKYVRPGSYTIELVPEDGISDCNTDPFTITVLPNDLDHVQDLHAIVEKEIIPVNVYTTRARVGRQNHGALTFYPKQTSENTLDISIVMPDDITGITFTVAPTSQSGNTYQWDDYNYTPGEQNKLDFRFFTGSGANMGDTLCWYGSVQGTDLHDDSHCTVVTNSYDPNEVEVNRESLEELDVDKKLKYTIHFQNTGNDTAYMVTVVDTLDEKLDMSTFKLLNASHEFYFEIDDNREMKWTFPNINLLDSASNEEASKGWLQFYVDFEENVVKNDVANSTAYIYFDTNEPIVTNTAKSTIVNTSNISEFKAIDFNVYPNPSTDAINLKASKQISAYQVMDIDGRIILNKQVNSKHAKIDVSQLSNGIYYIQVMDASNQRSVQLFEKM